MNPPVSELAAAVRSGDRAALPKAITLVESTRADHREQAQQLLLELMPDSGDAMHVGITGVPGVGNSTTIEALGMHLIEQGQRVAELADIVVVNKADGAHAGEAKSAARELTGAIRLIHPRETLWRPPVLTMSALHGDGLAELWETVLKHRQVLSDAGEFEARRRAQQVDWTWSMVRDTVLDRVLTHAAVKKIRVEVERQVRDGELTPALAAQQILDAAEVR